MKLVDDTVTFEGYKELRALLNAFKVAGAILSDRNTSSPNSYFSSALLSTPEETLHLINMVYPKLELRLKRLEERPLHLTK